MNNQISMFDGNNKFIINKPIRLIELFGGYGSQHFALEYLGVDFEQWKLCEWAVKSIQAYKDAHCKNDNTDYSKELTKQEIIDYLTNKGISANYNEPMTFEQVKRLSEDKLRTIYNNIKATHNLVNIQQVKGADLEIANTDKYIYILTYSFPCQDLSSAGLGKGMEKGSGTRSGMLWEVERILDEIKNENKELPQVLVMENVPEVIGTNNIKHFAKWLEKLESLGYHCSWKVLNGKDYGVPQNRERCFMVSVLGDYYYHFPEKKKFEIHLKDLLETNVDKSYYLSEEKISSIKNWKAQQDPLKDIDKPKMICPTLTARGAGEEHSGMVLINEDVYVGTFQYAKSDTFMEGKDRFAPDKKVSDTIQTTQKEGIVVGCATRGRYNQNGKIVDKIEILDEQVSNALTASFGNKTNQICDLSNLKIRKLTPKECFRLMGVKDKDFENIAENQSNASLYHLAGDSIIVDVLMAIFKQML